MQSARHVVAFLHAVHGNGARVLREDFCGTGAVARYWVRDARRRGDEGAGSRAVGMDLDEETVRRGREMCARDGVADGVELVAGDAVGAAEAVDDGCDVVFVGNFSIGYIHERAVLVEYLRRSRVRLGRGCSGFGGGVFVCDTYGGAGAWKVGGITRVHPSRGAEVIRYHWVHERADALTGMVENSIGFRVERDGEVVAEWARAFVYRWRLWAIHELRESMVEAGFAATEVHKNVNVAPGQAVRAVLGAEELGEDWVVLVVGREKG